MIYENENLRPFISQDMDETQSGEGETPETEEEEGGGGGVE